MNRLIDVVVKMDVSQLFTCCMRMQSGTPPKDDEYVYKNYALRERELELQEKQAETNRAQTAMMMEAWKTISSNSRAQSDVPQHNETCFVLYTCTQELVAKVKAIVAYFKKSPKQTEKL